MGEVPDWVARITVGADVQRQPPRVEASVWGWGEGLRSVLVDHRVFHGDGQAPRQSFRRAALMFTQADLDNIRACIASGVLKTRFADGREVQYQTLADMLAAEQRIAAVVDAATPGARPRRRFPAWRNGA